MQFTCAKNHQINLSHRQGIQMLQAKMSVGTTLIGPPCISRVVYDFLGYGIC